MHLPIPLKFQCSLGGSRETARPRLMARCTAGPDRWERIKLPCHFIPIERKLSGSCPTAIRMGKHSAGGSFDCGPHDSRADARGTSEQAVIFYSSRKGTEFAVSAGRARLDGRETGATRRGSPKIALTSAPFPTPSANARSHGLRDKTTIQYDRQRPASSHTRTEHDTSRPRFPYPC
jgi:hypothetical protein